MEAPEKIYLVPFGKPIKEPLPEVELSHPDTIWSRKPYDNKNAGIIKYIRKDVFVEKVLNFFENDLCCYIKAQNFTIEHRRLEENFKKYMEE